MNLTELADKSLAKQARRFGAPEPAPLRRGHIRQAGRSTGATTAVLRGRQASRNQPAGLRWRFAGMSQFSKAHLVAGARKIDRAGWLVIAGGRGIASRDGFAFVDRD